MRKKGDGFKTALLYLVILAVILAFVVIQRGGIATTIGESYNYGTMMTQIDSDEVKSITLQRDADVADAAVADVILKDGKTEYQVDISSVSQFMQSVDDKVKSGDLVLVTESAPKTGTWLPTILTVIMVIIGIVVLFFIMQQMQGGGNGKVMNFGKARTKNNDPKNKKTFADVAGLDEEKEEVQEIVQFLKNPKKFTDLGARIPKGVLMVGPPGTGKTLLAKAIAGEANVPFFSISGSDFVEMFVGVGASRVRDLFEQAKRSTPCLVFIDEIDAVGRRRGAGVGGGHDEREQTLNQLLVEMDGFGINEGVIIIAATNRPDILDPALLRPGRFDRQVVIGRPDVKGRGEILRVHAKNKKIAADVDLETIAKTTPGFTGADLENLMNEAALLAARQDKKALDMEDLRNAFVKVAMGTEKKSRVITDKEKKLTAYHEAGHAMIYEKLSELPPVHIVSIIPVGRAGGYTMPVPEEDICPTLTSMQQRIAAAFGGRIAEELILGEITTGASSDIRQASKMAREMVTKYGMSKKLGPILFGEESEEVFLGKEIGHTRNYGEEVASLIDEEVNRIITEAYDTATQIIKDNMAGMHRVAELLLEKEKITGDEFRAAIAEPAE
jgi:cell division protease FtsH